MKRQGIFLRTVKSRNRGRASERAVCGVFSDFSLAEPASHPAYAPTTKSPARYRTGRSKQHHHARNVKPLPPSGESEAGSARSLVRPIFLCCSLYLAPWRFPRLLSSPWPNLQAAQPTHLQQKARRGIGPGGPSSTILPETQHPPPGRRGAGSARCLFRPIFLCCSLYHAPGLFPCLFIFSLAGPARRLPSLRTCRNKPGAV